MDLDYIKDELKKRVGEDQYNKYIKNINIDNNSINTDNIIIYVQNKIILNWIKRKYLDIFEELFSDMIGTKPKIELQIKSYSHIGNDRSINNIKEDSNIKTNKLNPTYLFENFVVGSSNQVAYAIAKAVTENRGDSYNPLFIYGFSGLGKTHLLHSIGNEAINREQNVIYVTSEEFMNDFTDSLRRGSTNSFREKYRKCDYLLIDDIQFLSGKIETQVEFFNTFNALHAEKKQIVLTSDKPPKKIAGIEERLLSRFEWGMIIDIQPPELETKISIIKTKCEQNNIELNNEIINFIATNIGENIRELESTITTLKGYSSITNQEITLEFAKDVMKELIKEKRKNITLEEIIKVISKELNVKPSDIKSKKRSKNIVEARRIGIYLARKLTPNSMPSLANYFGMKDHTAVSHNMKKINQLLDENENFRLRVEELKNIITNKESN